MGEASYVLLYDRNRYRANCNAKLLSRLDRIQRNNKDVHFVRLFHNDSYYISDSDGTDWCGVSDQCRVQLQKWNKVEEIAVAKDGSWVVMFPMDFTYSDTGVDERLIQMLREFYSRQRERDQQRAEIMACDQFRMAHERADRERVLREEAAERARRECQMREEMEERARAEQRAAAVRQEENEARLERKIWQEAQSVSFLESLLQNHKRSLQGMVSQLPPERRPRVEEFLTSTTTTTASTTAPATSTTNAAISSSSSRARDKKSSSPKKTNAKPPPVAAAAPRATATTTTTVAGECVVCNDTDAEVAIVPCGHYCLCENCSKKMITLRNRQRRVCPLCRVPIQKTLKIFHSH